MTPEEYRVDPAPLHGGSRIAALVPHYRCERWLAGCLESLGEQSRPLDAIVVIDDGSGNPPAAIVERFPGVTLLAARENVGPYRLMQQVMDQTSYDGYLFQDADDWSSRDRLEALLEEAERTGAELVGSQEVHVFCDRAEARPFHYPLDVNAELRRRPGFFGLLQATSVVSRGLVQRLGGFATGLRFSGDSEFLQRAVLAGTVRNVPRYCYFRRKRLGSLTTDPLTGLRSPKRLELWEALRARAVANAAGIERGERPDLSPYAVAGSLALDHVVGPHLAPRPELREVAG